MYKASHLNFLSNTHFYVTNISSANPYFLVHPVHCCLTGNAFWHIKWPNVLHLSDSFLHIHFLFWIKKLFIPLIFLRQFNHCLTGNAFYHIQHIITNVICQRLIPQQHNKQCFPWSVNISTLLPPYCKPLPPLAACCSPLADQHWCWPLPLDTWSNIQLWSVHRPLSKHKK